ncbi:hypothetical protein PCC8801_3182 [Rippkaea orientalis PCC 8801]|uniref:Integral membrane protein n=1 Tax=Rippkaea orientalis (strain PCC 8801 / RF-1) TaxID=41431 RepID=B7JY59_RIPO1|nr:hypothetical protein [Rippkaea orientalis]ACK67161.1 hypothetical protein PCC8801_3182 [Rippkaea orientalis PCC 8801]
MTLIIERILAIFLVVTGLSYLVQSLLWRDLVKELRQNPSKILLWSILFLPLGLIIVIEHNLWIGNWQVIVTLFGWLMTLKCVFNLLFPSWSNFILKWSDEFLQRYIQISGVVVAILGVIIAFFSF